MKTSTGADGSVSGYFDLVRRNRNFRFLWMGQIVSLLGDWFNLIASASLVAALTNSGIAVGGLFVVRMLAPFLVSPFAGVAADRYNRKWLLVMSDLVRAGAVFGLLLVREPQHVWLLYALTAVQLGLSGVFFPTRNAILPDIVTRGELGAANALSAATWSVMLAFGAAIGGVVSGEWGVYPAFVIDALTFILSAVIIAQVAYEHTGPAEGSDRSVAGAMRQYVDGLRYLWRHKDTMVIAWHKAAFSLMVSGAFQVVQVTLAEQVFVIGEGGGTSLGLMYAAVGVGTGIGPIAARIFTGDRDGPLRVAVAIAYAVTALGLGVMAPLISFPLVLVGTFLRGIGNGIGWVFSTQLLLQLAPDNVRGRVFSTEFALFTLTNAAGAAAAGWLLDAPDVNLPLLLWWMAALTLVPGALWVGWMLFGKRGRPASESVAPPEEQPLSPGSSRVRHR